MDDLAAAGLGGVPREHLRGGQARVAQGSGDERASLAPRVVARVACGQACAPAIRRHDGAIPGKVDPSLVGHWLAGPGVHCGSRASGPGGAIGVNVNAGAGPEVIGGAGKVDGAASDSGVLPGGAGVEGPQLHSLGGWRKKAGALFQRQLRAHGVEGDLGIQVHKGQRRVAGHHLVAGAEVVIPKLCAIQRAARAQQSKGGVVRVQASLTDTQQRRGQEQQRGQSHLTPHAAAVHTRWGGGC